MQFFVYELLNTVQTNIFTIKSDGRRFTNFITFINFNIFSS